MHEPAEAFDWTVLPEVSWPPRRRPGPPFGPTAVEVIRSCRLRACFEASAGDYERRTAYAGRVGTAFHRTLEWLQRHSPAGGPATVAQAARARFRTELAAQEAEMAARPRERGLPRDASRAHRAEEAAVSEALRFVGSPATSGRSSRGTPDLPARGESRTGTRPAAGPGGAGDIYRADDPERVGEDYEFQEVEVEVGTFDGVLRGRVDLAVRTPEGTRIYDYKSALRDDLPDRYVRQVQLYALMWYQTRGEWPTHAEVVYPLAGRSHAVAVDPETCERVCSEALEVLAAFAGERDPYSLADPGDTCKVCDFRPWCEPFWRWQEEEANDGVALTRATLGLSGEVLTVETASGHWHVKLSWQGRIATIVAPHERFPHLHRGTKGLRLRVLDAELRGLRHSPRAVISPVSEIYLLEPLQK